MVLQLHIRSRHRLAYLTAVLAAAFAGLTTETYASERLAEAQSLFSSGDYFRAAQYAFDAKQGGAPEAESYALITQALVKAGMPQSASYFFIRTLQSQDRNSIRRALTVTEKMLNAVGVDLLRPYLTKHTKIEDYNAENRLAFQYSIAKDALLKGDEKKAVELLKTIRHDSSLYPYALQIRASAKAILGESSGAVNDFKACEEAVPSVVGKSLKREVQDLKNRCLAGQARVLYQTGHFSDADRTYDRIEKASFVWPEILFEQAWNAFSQREYNRSLGKLVSYKSPALKFVFNSEVDVLNAQSYLSLCLYSDANAIVTDFNSHYAKLGEEVKRFVESNASNLNAFFEVGKRALAAPLHTNNLFYKMMNRFVRSPYFQSLASAEKKTSAERRLIAQKGGDSAKGFSGFLNEVLDWRLSNVRTLGGAFVKNSLIDYHQVLIADFEKMSFIKLEMLKRAKEALMDTRSTEKNRERGTVMPARKDYQYRWSFNGEYWNDELGDYVFGLESQCRS